MSRPVAVLRPEPGNRITAEALARHGLATLRLPLFAVRPLDWHAPDPARFDALILTSANAVRHGGPNLAALKALPVWAVGDATAKAAEQAGFHVTGIGKTDGATLLEQAKRSGVRAALHLAAREHTLEQAGIVTALIPVYTSDALPIAPDQVARLAGSVALIQSTRAGVRLAELVAQEDRAAIAVAAISAKAAAALGDGWRQVETAATPDTTALIDLAARLAD